MSEYPRIGETIDLYKKRGICRLCGENKSDMRIDIQINNFRGDDEVFTVHKKCFKNGGNDRILNNIKEGSL